MDDKHIATARRECKIFLARLAERESLKWETTHHPEEECSGHTYPARTSRYAKEEGQVNGAIKRASLDLSRALAALRK